MKVSVVIPAFNAEASVARAIDSVLEQSLQSLEVIVVDDCSKDGTVKLVSRMAANDGRVRVVALPVNGGVSAARNAGMSHARGEWVAFLDADDAFLRTRLETLIALGERQHVDIVCDNILYYDWDRREIVGSGFDQSAGECRPVSALDFVSNSITGRSEFDFSLLKPLVRRPMIESGAYRYVVGLRQGEDFMVLAQALLNSATMVLSSKAFYVYTEAVGRESRTVSNMSRTIADFDEMRRQTLSLLDHPVVRGDPQLADAIARRARAILWTDGWERVYAALRQREFAAAGRVLASDWRAAAMLVRFIVRRLVRRAKPAVERP